MTASVYYSKRVYNLKQKVKKLPTCSFSWVFFVFHIKRCDCWKPNQRRQNGMAMGSGRSGWRVGGQATCTAVHYDRSYPPRGARGMTWLPIYDRLWGFSAAPAVGLLDAVLAATADKNLKDNFLGMGLWWNGIWEIGSIGCDMTVSVRKSHLVASKNSG